MESASTAWNRFLNLPGGGSDDDEAEPVGTEPSGIPITPRGEPKRPPPKDGRFYTHQELWNRSEPRLRTSTMGKTQPYDVIVQLEEKRVKAAVQAKVALPFVV